MSIDEALAAMVKHTEDNPTHGMDCACKDQYVREARRVVVGGTVAFTEERRVRRQNFALLATRLARD